MSKTKKIIIGFVLLLVIGGLFYYKTPSNIASVQEQAIFICSSQNSEKESCIKDTMNELYINKGQCYKVQGSSELKESCKATKKIIEISEEMQSEFFSSVVCDVVFDSPHLQSLNLQANCNQIQGQEELLDFTGQVLGAQENPLENIEVTVNNVSALTDKNGIYKIIAGVDSIKRYAHLSIQNVYYSPYIQMLNLNTLNDDQDEYILAKNHIHNIQLKPSELIEVEIKLNEPVIISSKNTDRLALSIPANTLVDQYGKIFEGNAKMAFTYLDPNNLNDLEIQPSRYAGAGTMLGIDKTGKTVGIMSTGMAFTNLQDDAGNALEIQQGETLIVSYPIQKNNTIYPPLTVTDTGYWHFNKTSGVWEEWETEVWINEEEQTWNAKVSKLY